MKPLDFSKPVQLREGLPVRIYCTDAKGSRPIHGSYRSPSGIDYMLSWYADGKYSEYEGPSELDLVQLPVRLKGEFWVNLYRRSDGNVYTGSVHAFKKYADTPHVCAGRLACIKVSYDVAEGEGL